MEPAGEADRAVAPQSLPEQRVAGQGYRVAETVPREAVGPAPVVRPLAAGVALAADGDAVEVAETVDAEETGAVAAARHVACRLAYATSGARASSLVSSSQAHGDP